MEEFLDIYIVHFFLHQLHCLLWLLKNDFNGVSNNVIVIK